MTGPSSQGAPETVEAFNQSLAELIERGQVRIPPYPAVSARLNEALSRPSCSMKEIAEVVGTDQALSASVVSHANSALYGASGSITSLTMAIQRLGTQELVRIVLAASAGGAVVDGGPLIDLKYRVWRDALVAAFFCREIARRRRLPAADAFLCGLLHDFGRAIALHGIEQVASAQSGVTAKPAEFWWTVVEKHHVELGGLLADKWGLPSMLRDVIAYHHSAAVGSPHRVELDLVKASDKVVDLMNRVAAVREEDLAELKVFRDAAEQSFAASLLPRLPAAVASLAPPPAPAVVRGPADSLTEKPPTTLVDARPTSFEVTCLRATGPIGYTVCGISPEGIALRGRERMSEGFLAKFRIDLPPEPFDLWVNITLVRQEGDEVLMEGRPFGLGGDVRARWMAVVDEPPASRGGQAE